MGSEPLAHRPADGLVKPMEGVEPNWATVEGRIERVNEMAKAEGKRAVRKDAVVMASEERLDALRWRLRPSPESSGLGVRG